MIGIEYADIAVIGAGAAGLMAACAASGRSGPSRPRIVLLERNARPGRKLSITGKGRCNITNGAEKEQFMRNIPGNGKFLYSAFSRMSNKDIVSFFERMGVETALERGGRYFTKSGDAREVTDAFARLAEGRGAELRCGTRVVSVRRARDGENGESGESGENADPKGRYLICLQGGQPICAYSVIVATGGITYPATGSTGDGYKFAAGLGHTVVAPRPTLTPLETLEAWPWELAGLTLKNVTLRLYAPDGAKVFSKLGEMLFTHFGVSGPLVLSGSRALLDCGYKGCAARIDLKPGLSDEQLRARIGRDFELYAKKCLRNAMADLLPSRLIPAVLAQAGLDADNRADAAGKAGIAKLSEALKGLALTIAGARPASEAIITAGGVRTDEINPSTMESKLAPGLYFCGEVIDVDAYTGGFNLSIAFATGHTAGLCAAEKAMDII